MEDKKTNRKRAVETVSNIVDDITTSYLRALLAGVDTKQSARQLIELVYDEYMAPMIEIRKALDTLTLLEEYITACGDLRSDVLDETKTKELFKHFGQDQACYNHVVN